MFVGTILIKNIPVQMLENAVLESNTLSEVAGKVGLSPSSRGTASKLSKRLKELGINTDNFDNWNSKRNKPISKFLTKHSKISHTTLKQRLIKECVIPYKCSCCGNDGVHNGANLVLQLDHINGDNTNNEITNLRFLCPNCHSQTITYGGRNKQCKQ